MVLILSGSIIDVRLFRQTIIIYARLVWHRRRYKLVQFIDGLTSPAAAVQLDTGAQKWYVITGSTLGHDPNRLHPF